MRKLTEIIKKYQIISVIGNAKNAGKTTVINSILKDLNYRNLAITSIGLDGEEIDQVTFLEKPRIFCHKGYLIATAKDTLKAFDAEFQILENTDIFTSIGNVVVVKIIKAGNALIAGPSVILDMEKLIEILLKYHPINIFVDGAFFRHSLAKLSDAFIYVVGANLTNDMNRVIEDAKANVKKFDLKLIRLKNINLEKINNICLIDEKNNIKDLNFNTVIGNLDKIFVEENRRYKYLFLPRALTNEFLIKLIKNRNQFEFNIIINSPINIQLNTTNLTNLFKLKNQVYVVNKVNLAAICLNPISSRGYEFDILLFKQGMEKALQRVVFNVKEDDLDG